MLCEDCRGLVGEGEELSVYDLHVQQTSKVFRDAGFTMAAIQYPLSATGVAWVLAFNRAPAGWTPPHGWRYAPNPAMRKSIETKASAAT